MRSFAVFHLFYSVVVAVVDDSLFFHFCMSHIINECPADTSAVSGVNKTILWTSVQCVFSVNKFWMQNDIALLAFGNQIRQTFPILQVFGADDTCFCNGRRQIARSCVRVKAFATENTINPTVFVCCQAHIVDICLCRISIR